MLRNQMKRNKSHRAWNLFVVLALGLACLVAVGCGSSDDGGDTGSDTSGEVNTEVLAKAEYVKLGNEICAESIKKREAGLKDMFARLQTEEISEKEQEELAEDLVLPALYQMVEELAALGLPEGKEAQAEKMLKGYENAVEKFEGKTKLALTQYATYMNKPSGVAEELGLSTCTGV